MQINYNGATWKDLNPSSSPILLSDLAAQEVDISYAASDASRPGAKFFDGSPLGQLDVQAPWYIMDPFARCFLVL